VKREWKPGDLAMVRVQITTNPDDGSEEHMLFRRRGKWEHPDFGIWEDRYVLAARPLVVIDPEDREQIGRLVEELYVWGLSIHNAREKSPTDVGDEYRAGMADRVQGALRDIANPQPPKPEEPTGAGAVVEDATGHYWVRIADASEDPVAPYLKQASPPWRRRGATARWWDKVNAVRVLSEGVVA